MKCPHCLENFFDKADTTILGGDSVGFWILEKRLCPSCGKFILHLARGQQAVHMGTGQTVGLSIVQWKAQVLPKGASRPPCPEQVPVHLANDYNEACLVIPDSAKASAALSRRCLQALLRESAHVKPSDLSNEIQQVLDSKALPSYMAESIDAVRNIGNFAAHPMKSQHTGEILDVEPGEAEWNLEVLESLFDFYFVQPAILKAKRAALDAKLGEAGKPSMK